MLSCVFFCHEVFSNFPFDFFFDPMVVQECTIYFLHSCEFPSFASVNDFYFHPTVVRQDTWYDFNFLKFVNSFCNLTCNLPLRNIHAYLRRMCIVLLLDGMFCISLLGSFGVIVLLKCRFLIDLLSGCSSHYWKLGLKVSYYYGIIVYFSLQFCQYLLYIFRYLDVGGINIYILFCISGGLILLSLYHVLLCLL